MEGAYDSLNDSPYNEGSYYRKQQTAKGQTFEMEGLLSEDDCSELFYEDMEGAYDSLNDSPYNEGSYYRKQQTAKGQTFEMEGLLSEDDCSELFY